MVVASRCPLETKLPIQLLQSWFTLSDPVMKEALYEISSMRQFARLALSAPIPGVEKRSGHEGRQVIWQIADHRSTYKHLSKRSV